MNFKGLSTWISEVPPKVVAHPVLAKGLINDINDQL
jgi:hypothetical protein